MAFYMPDSVTVSHNVDDAYDFGRFLDNQLPSQQSPDAHYPYPGGGDPSHSRSASGREVDRNIELANQQQAWMYATQGILYYAFPMELMWGIVTGIISLIVFARQRKTSNDSYLIGFTVASVLLLICSCIIKIQDYILHSDEHQKIYGYVKSAHDWLWYSALWLLVVLTLERGLTLMQNRSKNFCSAVQALIIVLVIFSVCLISALPEFWEYETIEVFEYRLNRTILVSRLTDTADSPEYKIMYFWYSVTIMVILPYPILIAMIVLLAKNMHKTRHSKKRLAQKQGNLSVFTRKTSEEMHLTRMYIVMMLLYILLSGPLTFLIIVNGITPLWSWPVADLYTGLHPILEFVFYFYFSIQFFLYLTYYDKFRHSFLRTFCCCCCCGPCRHHRKNRDSLRRHESKQNALYSR